MVEKLHIRLAESSDVKSICDILSFYADKQLLLPREASDVKCHIANFTVVYSGDTFAGCVALRDFDNNLFEVRSLAISPDFIGKQLGSRLLEYVISDLNKRKPCKLFALTYRSNFFIRLGFTLVSKDLFPEKIWSDCAVCPKKDNCDEDAVLMEIE